MAEALRSDELEALLLRLGPDREVGGRRYEQLRRRLEAVFAYRRCAHPEELADETLDRVARKLFAMGTNYEGTDPLPYVFAVASNVARESFRRHAPVPLADNWEMPDPAQPNPADDEELGGRCLDRCLRRLPEGERDLVLKYFDREKGARIRHRWILALELRISPNALRLKIHRTTLRLRECVSRCVESRGECS